MIKIPLVSNAPGKEETRSPLEGSSSYFQPVENVKCETHQTRNTFSPKTNNRKVFSPKK